MLVMIHHLRHFALLTLLAASACTHTPSGPAIHEASTSYLSGGKKIKVETFLPAAAGQHPAVIVLYGSGGSLNGKGDMNTFARQLAQRGMAAYMIHYFNRTGTLLAGDKSIAAENVVWQATVTDGIDFVMQQPQVRPGQIGMFGYSLGAFLTVGAATTDPRVGVAAELSGGIFDRLRGHTKRYPPLLILHGRNDERVPMHYEQALEKDTQRFNAHPVVQIYPGEGHSLSPTAAADASARALSFLQQHLKP